MFMADGSRCHPRIHAVRSAHKTMPFATILRMVPAQGRATGGAILRRGRRLSCLLCGR
jgi:hypothetical protein